MAVTCTVCLDWHQVEHIISDKVTEYYLLFVRLLSTFLEVKLIVCQTMSGHNFLSKNNC